MTAKNEINHDLNQPKIIWIMVSMLLVVVFLALIYIYSIYFYKAYTSKELNDKAIPHQKSQEQLELAQYESLNLNTFQWIDRKSKKVQVPIHLAMSLVIRDYQHQ